MAARSAAAPLFFIRASFLLSWSHESLCCSACNAKGDPNSFLSFYGFTVSFFKDLCRPLSRQFIKKRMAHLRQSIFCVKIPKHLDCAKGIADHDSGLLHPVNLRSVTLYTGWMASIFRLQSFVSQNGAGAPQCFFSLALKRPIKNTGFLL